ncbi:substrate-binding domain-containing protein [Ideonella paludis]|uniref:substrate-binding domain-containing protein n=1 Tax=Ideonella paludis TaxID=1233411 RepID=UPI00363C60E8
MSSAVRIRPVWAINTASGSPLPARLLELLVQVQACGSLQAASTVLGLSYRHAWDLLRQGESLLGGPLLSMARGKGSSLTPLGAKLVWAQRRIEARLGPLLETLANELSAELSAELAPSLHGAAPALRLHASHGFAIEALLAALSAQGVALEHRYASTVAAAAALQEGHADIAGLHLPEGALEAVARARYAPWLGETQAAQPGWQMIHIARRRQGLMLPPGNPLGLSALIDLARTGLRFINRQADSGTRLLLEGLLAQQGLSGAQIRGFEQSEFTHAAVAAYVASGMADAGFGLETAARQFKLDFIPLASERYFLVCRPATLQHPTVQALRLSLQEPALREQLNALPGYQAEGRET